MIRVGIYGAGGFGKEVAWLLDSCNQRGRHYEILCFIDDNPSLHGKILNGIRVMGFDEARQKYPSIHLVRGTGSVRASVEVIKKSQNAGLDFLTVIHPNTEYSKYVTFGKGTVVCSGSIFTTNVTVGDYVQVNLNCTIGHDVRLGDYTTIAPGVHISGYVHVGKRVYIGTGAVIVNGTEESPVIIGDDVTIGAGACVTKSIPSNSKVVGVPAKPI
ncbi:MAG: acetyltransferase [Smithellaceae bacterium]|nr:acetyltransferase [Deltaproteobacteria bacterium]HQB59081.1 acetyltransferase [Bacteroidales bacterium]